MKLLCVPAAVHFANEETEDRKGIAHGSAVSGQSRGTTVILEVRTGTGPHLFATFSSIPSMSQAQRWQSKNMVAHVIGITQVSQFPGEKFCQQ